MIQSFSEKREASKIYFLNAANQPSYETTPVAITPKIQSFMEGLSIEPSVWTPVVDDPVGLFGWCSDGVLERVRLNGGSICYGWTIWELPKLLITAEFHAVWVDAHGKLWDITPKPAGETQILFAPDNSYPQDFDFDRRPRNRRMRLYEAPDRRTEVLRRLGEMKPSQLAYETNRAERAGKSLEEWLVSKLEPDTLAPLIDTMIELCEQQERKLDEAMPGAGIVHADDELQSIMRKRAKVTQKVLSYVGKV